MVHTCKVDLPEIIQERSLNMYVLEVTKRLKENGENIVAFLSNGNGVYLKTAIVDLGKSFHQNPLHLNFESIFVSLDVRTHLMLFKLLRPTNSSKRILCHSTNLQPLQK